MAQTGQFRTYDTVESVVFLKTKARFGGLSNMAAGFPSRVNGIYIRTSEALYQACRFPHRPDVQRRIIDERSPMTAKMRSKPYRHDSRPDWDQIRVDVMRWCLRVKLAQNWDIFSELLLDTGERSIVERSRKDDFWGAKSVDERMLVGMNVLGRLLMELREAVKNEPRENLLRVEPFLIKDFLLGGYPIKPIAVRTFERAETVDGSRVQPRRRQKPESIGVQLLLALAPKVAAYPSSEDTTEWAGDGGIGHLKPYPAYKPSGVKWLWEVPEHWEVVRLRNTSEMRVSNVDKHAKDDEQPVRLCNYVDVYKNDRIRSGMAFMSATATTDEIERFRLRSGDVLITKDSEAWNDIGVPALVEDTGDDVVSGYHLALLRPFHERVNGGYLFRSLQSTAVAYQFHVEANGVTRYGLSHSTIKSVWLPLPPLPEQVAIVRFLDHSDRRIRRYIRSKQKLITLLEEQKQAIIHQAVTGQMDVRTGQPYPTYKPSGVEWLGDVPEHWEVRRLKFILAAPLKYGANEAAELDDPDLPRYVRITDINENDGLREETFKSLPSEVAAEYLLRRGDLLFARSGATAGKTFLYRTNWGACAYAGYLIRARIDEGKAVPEFVRHFTASTCYWQWLSSVFIQATIPNVSAERYASLWVPLPSVREQAVIADFLDLGTAKIDAMVAKIETAIERLQEYRTRLIADVVTGKLDVREAATRLPDKSDEPEPIDEDTGPIDRGLTAPSTVTTLS